MLVSRYFTAIGYNVYALVDLPLLERRQLLACRAHDGIRGRDVEGVVALALVRAGFLLFLLLLCLLWLVLLVAGGRG